jgi:hypothetical protein
MALIMAALHRDVKGSVRHRRDPHLVRAHRVVWIEALGLVVPCIVESSSSLSLHARRLGDSEPVHDHWSVRLELKEDPVTCGLRHSSPSFSGNRAYASAGSTSSVRASTPIGKASPAELVLLAAVVVNEAPTEKLLGDLDGWRRWLNKRKGFTMQSHEVPLVRRDRWQTTIREHDESARRRRHPRHGGKEDAPGPQD